LPWDEGKDFLRSCLLFFMKLVLQILNLITLCDLYQKKSQISQTTNFFMGKRGSVTVSFSKTNKITAYEYLIK
jgi:hypothetical protein